MPSSSALPQKLLRASTHATAMPNGSATTVATTAMRSESSTAVHSSGVRENKKASRRLGRWLDQERKAISLEHGLRGTGTQEGDRKSTRLNSSHQIISYAVFCLKKKKKL